MYNMTLNIFVTFLFLFLIEDDYGQLEKVCINIFLKKEEFRPPSIQTLHFIYDTVNDDCTNKN